MKTSYQQRKERFIKFFEHNKRLPSYGEMLGLFSLKSKNTIACVVSKFIEEGLVKKDRIGRLIPKNILGRIKLLGTVEAGWPSPAEEELADTVSLDEYLIRNRAASFLLRVSGESMTGAGIHPGDLVIVERGRTPAHGEIVVAEVDHEWTVKRYQIHGGKITLVPENPKFKPVIPKEILRIAGVVTAVIRKYK